MNRYVLFGCIICIAIFACRKNGAISPSSQLDGKWVIEPGNNAMNDTLIFYEQGASTMFFDKSVYFLVNAAAWTTANSFKYHYLLGEAAGDSVETRSLTSTNPQPWVTVYFKQLSANEIEIGDFRFGSSDSTIKYSYRRVE